MHTLFLFSIFILEDVRYVLLFTHPSHKTAKKVHNSKKLLLNITKVKHLELIQLSSLAFIVKVYAPKPVLWYI